MFFALVHSIILSCILSCWQKSRRYIHRACVCACVWLWWIVALLLHLLHHHHLCVGGLCARSHRVSYHLALFFTLFVSRILRDRRDGVGALAMAMVANINYTIMNRLIANRKLYFVVQTACKSWKSFDENYATNKFKWMWWMVLVGMRCGRALNWEMDIGIELFWCFLVFCAWRSSANFRLKANLHRIHLSPFRLDSALLEP